MILSKEERKLLVDKINMQDAKEVRIIEVPHNGIIIQYYEEGKICNVDILRKPMENLPDRYAGITLSQATMRKEDLIPPFYNFIILHSYAYKLNNDFLYGKLIAQQTVHSEYDEDFINWDSYYESEESDFDLQDLFDILNEIAPEGCYFGSHKGDGSLYGFWQYEKENCPNVDDCSKPEGHTGDCGFA